MQFVTDHVKKLPQSKIRNMFNLASKMDDVVSFALGEPDFPTPANIIEAANRAILEGNTHYTLNAGILPLRRAVAENISAMYKAFPVDAEREVAITIGGTQALFLLFTTILDPGDEIILTEPYWCNYTNMVNACRGVCRYVKVCEEDGFAMEPDAVERLITKRTKAIIINSPANPTGSVMPRERLEKLAEICIKHDILAISDEVYRYFVYENTEFYSIAQCPGMRGRTVIIDSFSKSYAMTGWRVGYAAGPEEIISNMVKYQENVAASNNNHAQYGALEALTGPQEALHTMIATYARRRQLVLERISKIEGIHCHRPEGAFYVYLNLSEIETDMVKFAVELLKKQRVCLIPDAAFGPGGTGYLRMSYATSDMHILEGLARLEEFTKAYRG